MEETVSYEQLFNLAHEELEHTRSLLSDIAQMASNTHPDHGELSDSDFRVKVQELLESL